MKNKKGFLLDAVVGLLLTLFVAGSYLNLVAGPLLASFEFKAYDLRAKLRESLKSPEEIVIVAVDDDAIAQLGRWPWPRTRIAEAIDRIAKDKPRVIGLNVLFSEAEQNQGLGELKRLEDKYKELIASRKIVQRGADFSVEFSSASAALDSDTKLLASLQSAGNVVLPLFFVGNPTGAKQPDLPVEISSAALASTSPETGLMAGEKLLAPLQSFVAASGGVGHANLTPESDGVVRRVAPLIEFQKRLFPAFALRVAMGYYGLKPSDLRFTPGVEVSAGKLRVPIDEDGQTAVTFLGPPSAQVVKRISYQQLWTQAIGADYFKDKIVLVGLTASGTQSNFSTPLAGETASVEVMANAVENYLHQRYLTRPPWARRLELGLLAAIGLFVMIVLPRLRAFWGLVVSLLFAVAIGVGGAMAFSNGEWIKIGYPLALLLAGYLVVISKSFLVTEKGKELVEASAIETNKMLGLSFQGQGMLDLAFEKFRLCPLDDNMKDTLYNLALDFERKRQFSKAAAVLDHIATKAPKYKDVPEKTKMLKAAADGAVFGGVGGGKKEGTVMITGGATKPTLGRYEIEKELGRGAMGVVYLGRDPKINRMVAIKTMMLEEGTDGGSAKEVKERFFREAESAGTLNHPNIVRIFDAGEENEVAYIAMELLDGQDLTKNTAKDALLPVEKAVEYVATVADALDYAHKQGIVHRDIKPANIMLLKDGSVRVADFGIARITASSKTATGTVMGTPSYMSPEQVAGRKVDGRSDLFSLTVALYELLTGEKPFKGGEGIGTLLFQIANDPTPDILEVNPKVSPALKAVIEKGLAKNPDERYQRGSELASALRAALSGAAAPAPASAAPAPERTAPTTEITAPVASAAAPAPAKPKTVQLTAADLPELDAMLNQAGRELTGAPDRRKSPAPVPAPVDPPPAEKTAPDVSVSEFPTERMPPAPAPVPAPAPAPSSVRSDKTVRIGPEIMIPGLNDRPSAATPSPAPAPAAPPAPGGMTLEMPTHLGVGSSEGLPPPPKKGEDLTVRLDPPKEPS
ncbi:MAG: CHASE2 domain-containing protein [Elusimicrobia bacterium]|nr:CHASE2 domain-containing protein [Elusimicrobiota bacterium]